MTTPSTWPVLALLLISRAAGDCGQDCAPHYVTDCQVCHNIHVKQCDIVTKTVMAPVKVRKCYPVRLTTFDGLECRDGARTRCKVRYETECSKTIEYQVIEEDFPDCRTEKVRSCRGDTERDASNLVSPQCRYVGVRRCKIVKRSRKKARPRHQCRRVPRKECVKVPCYQREECRLTIRLEAKELPEEKCQLLPQRICQEGECRRRLSTQCDCQETPAALP